MENWLCAEKVLFPGVFGGSGTGFGGEVRVRREVSLGGLVPLFEFSRMTIKTIDAAQFELNLNVSPNPALYLKHPNFEAILTSRVPVMAIPTVLAICGNANGCLPMERRLSSFLTASQH